LDGSAMLADLLPSEFMTIEDRSGSVPGASCKRTRIDQSKMALERFFKLDASPGSPMAWDLASAYRSSLTVPAYAGTLERLD
jgi:hypothetical protein